MITIHDNIPYIISVTIFISNKESKKGTGLKKKGKKSIQLHS
jgi:hypothetical protein